MSRRRAPRWAGLLAAGCVLSAQAAALELHDGQSGLDPGEAARARTVRAQVLQRLPPAWSGALGDVRLEWSDDLPGGVHGRAFGDRIALRRSLLREQDERPAAAALVHELAHLYDRSAAGRLSRDPRLLDLAGWQDAPLRPWRTGNHFTDRTPDPYELESPREYVAVNLEHYLLDDDYACRRPALARYFDDRFGERGATGECPPDLPFVGATEGQSEPLAALDPARVQAVEYLLAEGNERPMSRWGHSMLRLVVCAPGRAVGPDCRLDLAWHKVLSFRAFVDDVQVSSWRGLTGSYPSRLFLLPLTQVVDEYTKVELRGLRSIPLRLHRDEIATLLQRAAQLHWSYDGRYYFIGNNCAVETARLLHDGIGRLRPAGLSSITPRGLLRKLDRAGIADTGVLGDLREATRDGYYFPSASARHEAMFGIARDALELPQHNVQQWLRLPAKQRAAAFGDADLRTSAALLLLEEAALRRLELEARDMLKRHLSAASPDAGAILAIEDALTRPSRLAPDGYGLPQATERASIADDARKLADRLGHRRSALMAHARALLPAAARRELDAATANVAALGQRLRTLHETSGGLRLD